MIKLAHPIIEEDEKRAVIEALESSQLAQGPRVASFERAFAAYIGVKHAIAVNSGTAALHVALMAHGIGDGGGGTPDEVIVPAFSFAATANTVLQAGARLAFVDIRDEDFGIDVSQVEASITPKTRAVIAVHLYGQPCDIAALADLCAHRHLTLIEDAAQAVGAMAGAGADRHRAGSIGTGTFSFYATKNLTTGEGGMVATNDDAVADRARTLRSQGERTRYVTEMLGYNYRMTEVAAALGDVQLAKIEARNEKRRANAARLTSLLAGCDAIVTPRTMPARQHVWHQYTIRVRGGRDVRDALQSGLRERGIESAVFYPAPIHRQPLYARLGYGNPELPVAQRVCDEVLSLPVHPSLTDAELEQVASAVVELAG